MRSSSAVTGVGIGAGSRPVSTSTPNGGGGWSAARWRRSRGLEVAQLLARQRRDDDAADAHRPGPRERLGVDPRADDEDAAGPADVDAARPELAERVRRELETAVRRRARGERAGQREARGADPDLGARPDLADRRPRAGDRPMSRCSPVTTRQLVLAARDRRQQLALDAPGRGGAGRRARPAPSARPR